jgi:hypothetical protein
VVVAMGASGQTFGDTEIPRRQRHGAFDRAIRPYPFVLSPEVVEKLDFVHRRIHTAVNT